MCLYGRVILQVKNSRFCTTLSISARTRRTQDAGIVYPVPQRARCVSAGIIDPDSLPVENPKAMGVGPWFGVYLCLRVIPMCTEWFTNDTRGSNV